MRSFMLCSRITSVGTTEAPAPGPPPPWSWLVRPEARWSYAACCLRQWSQLTDTWAAAVWSLWYPLPGPGHLDPPRARRKHCRNGWVLLQTRLLSGVARFCSQVQEEHKLQWPGSAIGQRHNEPFRERASVSGSEQPLAGETVGPSLLRWLNSDWGGVVFNTLVYLLLTAKWSEVKWKELSPVLLFATPLTVHGILQARILEWVAFPFFRGSSQLSDKSHYSLFCQLVSRFIGLLCVKNELRLGKIIGIQKLIFL